MAEKREVYSSRAGTILTMVGVAVGLGNVWRFPYMMGAHGGSAFLFVYLFFVVFFGLPAVMAEWALGRATRSGPMGAFGAAIGRLPGTGIGAFLSISVLVANTYYLVVIAWVIVSAWVSATSGFQEDRLEEFGATIESGRVIAPVAVVTLLAGLGIIGLGLRRGIERASKLIVPFFGVVVLYLIFHAFALEGAPARFAEFLKPEFGKLTPTNVFAALGQAFFSLSLGGTFFVIYGSYLREDERIPGTAIWTGLGDAGAALLASLFIIPCLLVFGIDMASGPTVVFETLPRLFIQLPAGRLVGTFFFTAFALVAVLSSIAALEVGIGGLRGKFGWSARRSICVIGAFEIPLIIFFAFKQNLIEGADLILGSGMQCLGSMLALLALGWGLGRAKALTEIFGTTSSLTARLYIHWIRWVVPGGITIALFMATDLGSWIVGKVAGLFGGG